MNLLWKKKMKVKFQKFIYREDVQSNPNWVYVFGDNLVCSGMGGQAKEMRYEKNSFGIPTKRLPSSSEKSFFTDQPDEVTAVLREIYNLSYLLSYEELEGVVWPADGIGTGLAEMEVRSPKIFAIIKAYEDYLKSFEEEQS